MKTNHTLLTLLLLACCQIAQAKIAVIINPANSFDLEAVEIRKLFLKKTKTLPNGLEAIPVDLPDNNPNKALFSKLVLRKSEASLNSYWSRMLFSSKGQPPKKMNPEEIKAFVANNKQAIAYIDTQDVDNSVKVILTVP